MTPQERVAQAIFDAVEARAARLTGCDPGHWGDPASASLRDEAHVSAAAAIAALTSDEAVAEWAAVLNAHVARPASSPFCACEWRPLMSFNDTESDRGQHRTHQAEALRNHLRGASCGDWPAPCNHDPAHPRSAS